MSKQSRYNKLNAQRYKNEVQKAQLGNNIANHMAYIFMEVLYDKFNLSFKQLNNFYTRVIERRVAWQKNEVTSLELVEYCKKIDVVGWVKSIPMSHKLYLADIHKSRALIGADKNIESALASTMFLTIPTLKKTYRFNNADVSEFMRWVKYFIDSYYRKQPGTNQHYLSDQMIRQMFIEDEHYDIEKGCAVEE